MTAAIVTYHAIDGAPSPLCVGLEPFREHLDLIRDRGWTTVTVAQLAAAFASGRVPDHTIALTFDDGFANVAEVAAPELAARGMTATVFCVAGHVGGWNDWPTDREGGYRARLADAGALRALAGAGVEIGAHGYHHAPLVSTEPGLLRRELLDARAALEDALGTPVSSVAYPYGAGPSRPAADLVRTAYAAGCTTELRALGPRDDRLALPRIDAHYVRRPELFERLLDGRLGKYLSARGLAARARRSIRKDYVLPDRP